MAGGGTFCLLLLDSLVRRLVLPLCLVAAVMFRYNAVSLVYLLCLLASFLLPSTRNSSHSAFPLFHECLLVVLSLVATLVQVFFQVTLVTDYSNEFEPCTFTESAWRQSGFILFGSGNQTLYPGPPVGDVLRNLLIDVGMFAVSLTALIVTAVTVAQLRKQRKSPVRDSSAVPSAIGDTDLSAGSPGSPNAELQSLSHSDEETRPPSRNSSKLSAHPASVQQPFIQVPHDLLFLLEVVFISFLVLSASAVPSIPAIVYMLVFLLLALLWSIHITVPILKFVIWNVIMAMVGVHLVVLYIFQFQSVQEAVGVDSADPSNSTALRLSGITPWILTNCFQPTELRLSDMAIYSWYLNPIFLLLLFATTALNVRLRVFKPKVTWNSKNIVFFPSFTPRYWTSYSYAASDTSTIATRTTDMTDGYAIPLLRYPWDNSSPQSGGAAIQRGRKEKSTWLQVLTLVREVGFAISFGLALVSMMAWSVVFPSWLSLVLLLWACCIWLFPKLNAKWALLYTSPLLLLFSVVLFVLQYITYLNFIPSEVPEGLMWLITNSIVTEAYEPLLHFPLIFVQFVLVGSFFLAVYTLVDELKRRRSRKRESRMGHRLSGEDTDVGSPPPLERQITLVSTMAVVNSITDRLYKYVCYYWVLVTMAAFLLAALVGDPTLFKAVYMIGFVLSLLFYQTLPTYWYKVCVPMWGLFIVYSFFELTAIYIYQLQPILDILNDADSQNGTELLTSIGFPHIPAGGDRSSIPQLLTVLLPPTVFIAVMASQLRYFYPQPWNEDRKNVGLEAAGEDARSLLVSAHQSLRARAQRTKKKPPTAAKEAIMQKTVGGPELGGSKESDPDAPKTVTFGAADKTDKDVTPSKWEKAKQTTSELARFAGHWLWQWILTLNQLFWRLIEIHLHKIIALVIFSIVITQLGAILMVVLIMVVLTSPLRQMNIFFYPVFTCVIGSIVVLKMIYQVPIVTPNLLDLRRNNCMPLDVNAYANSLTGPVLGFAFSPRGNDSNWFGFHKLTGEGDSFVAYISGYIAVLLLLAFWFVVRRRMARNRTNQDGNIVREEKGALFPGITRNEAERNILTAFKYSVNHAFDYYGAEICCCLLAITMAVRDDVYSVIYGIILGLCLILTVTPRALVVLLWPFLTYAVGLLIVVQYAFLLGVPDGACFRPNNKATLDYPWTADPGVTVQLRKWLYLSDYADILNRDYLYADFITFIAMCLKTFRIFRGAGVALNLTIGDEWDGTLKGYWMARKFLVILQTILFGNWFWLCLLFLFFTGAVNASVWGYVYLLMSFAMSWWGREMLASDLSRLRLSWETVRAIVLLLMVVRAALQVLGCAVQETGTNFCLLRLVLRANCSQITYYYKPDAIPGDCDNAEPVGLALDAVLFIVLTIQILIIQSQAFGSVQVAYRKKLAKSHRGARLFDDLVKQRLIDSIHEQRTQVEEVNARLSLLEAHQGRLLAHKMHAGVRIPKDIKILKSNQSSQATSETGTPLLDRPLVQPSILRQNLESKTDVRTESSQGLWHIIKSYISTGYAIFLEWLEQQSEIYRHVQEGLDRTMTPEGDEASASAQPGGDISASESGLFGGSEAIVERGTGAVREGASHPQQPQSGTKGEDMVDSTAQWLVSSAERRRADEDMEEERPKLDSAGDADMHLSLELVDSGDSGERQKTYTRSRSVDEILEEVETIGSKIARLIRAIYYFLIANTAYICYFFLIMNIIFNGSVLSLVYALILFFWGLLTIPYPTQRFWLAMIFYTMLVVLVKYSFQFEDFDPVVLASLQTEPGLPVLQVLGIEKADNFLLVAVWDILLLLSLILHRALLKESGLWREKGLRFAIISEIREEVEENDEHTSAADRLSYSEDVGRDEEDAPTHSPGEEPIVYELEESWQDIDEVLTQESITIWKKMKQTLRKGFYGLYRFYVKAISPNITFGARDFYVLTVLLDAICFCILVLGFSSFGLGQGELQQVVTYVQTNSIPLPFLIVLLLQFLSMLMDRLIYLRKSLPMKLLFNVFLIVVWHAYLFFILPYYTATPFLDNKAAQAIYFFKAWYFVASSFQIVSGYPHRVLGYFWGKSPNIISGAILQVYRYIPIIPLLREVMDWTMTRTSLRLKHYLTVQEIWAKLFLIRVYKTWERASPRNLGQPSSILIRLLLGGGFILALVLLLWGPLLVISAITAGNIANPPVDFSIEVAISGFPALLTLAAQRRFITTEISQPMFNDLKSKYSENLDVMNQFNQDVFLRVQFTRIVMQGEGSLLWTITNPARDLLITSLNDSSTPLDLLFKWTITRNPPSGLVAERVEGRQSISMDRELRDSLIATLDVSSTEPNVTIPGLFPRIMTGPANGMSSNDTPLNDFSGDISSLVTCLLMHVKGSNGEFWSLKQNIPTLPNSEHLLKDSSDPTSESLEFIVFSERVSLPEFDYLVGEGIIGLYTAVVLVVANLLRDWVSSLFYQLPYDEIPNPDYLLDLCNDIFIARESGELVIEEILTGHLVYILRSNAKLLEWTKSKLD